MKSTAYLVATLAILLVPSAAQLVPDAGVARDAVRFDLSAIPLELGSHRSRAEQILEPEVLAQIQPAAYLMRLYTSETEPPFWLYVALYPDATSIGAHDPAICYPAQGWEIVSDRDVVVPLADAAELHARTLLTRSSGQAESVLYWFQPAERWPTWPALEQLLRSVDAIAGRPQYAFVRLSTPHRPEAGEVDRDWLEALAVRLAPAVREVVDGAQRSGS